MGTAIAQVNVRMDRGLKERGDATLRLAGTSPAKVIRQLWERLAAGGEAYEQIMGVLCPNQDATTSDDPHQLVVHSASLFQELGASLGIDPSTFEPDERPTSAILEELEWERMEERRLA